MLAFEDMQWADASLLDFVEYLLEWSRDSPLYVITLARPELQEKRPSWGAGQRNFTSLYLEPLSGQAMRDLLEGLVPGLPDELRTRILERAQGVPLYAVETVRMLLDRGLLVREGSVYRPTGEIETLAVPETLHALIAARLDGVSPEERRLLQDGAVLGKTFTVAAVAALADSAPADLEPLLAGLVRKEVLGVQSDPRSPERGQYGFLQDLVRHVAYETLSKRERKFRHLAAASHLRQAFPDEDEVAEVLAAHYLAAVEAAPGADDAAAIRAQAGEMLTRAGERASSLGALDEGRRYYDQAAELAEETLVRAGLLERAGELAQRANLLAEARERLERAHSLNLQGGDAKGVARVNAALAELDFLGGAYDAALVRLEQVTAELERAGALVELAGALALFGRVNAIRGHVGPAAAATDRALALAEHLLLPDVFVEALTTKGIVLLLGRRLDEARILLEAAAERARAEQFYASALRADNNLATVLQSADRYAEVAEAVDRGIALARRRGERRSESVLRTGNIVVLFMLGRWDEACAIGREEAPSAVSEIAQLGLIDLAQIACERGDLQEARRVIGVGSRLETSENPQSRAGFAAVLARVLRAEGDHVEALAAARRGLALRAEISMVDIAVKGSFVEAVESSLALGDLELADELLLLPASLDPGDLTPFLQASVDRLRARLQAARGAEDGVEDGFRSAGALLREFGIVFHAAVAELEHAEWLVGQGRADEAGALVSAAAGDVCAARGGAMARSVRAASARAQRAQSAAPSRRTRRNRRRRRSVGCRRGCRAPEARAPRARFRSPSRRARARRRRGRRSRRSHGSCRARGTPAAAGLRPPPRRRAAAAQSGRGGPRSAAVTAAVATSARVCRRSASGERQARSGRRGRARAARRAAGCVVGSGRRPRSAIR